MNNWTYGGAYLLHPIEYGQSAVFSNGGILKVHNIFEQLPEFMIDADLMFIDPPWNLGNLNSFYTKAGRQDYNKNFEEFYSRLFQCIADIMPDVCYIEIGKQYLPEFMIEAKKLFRHVTFYNSSYYHKKDNICYVIRCSKKKHSKLPLDHVDEEHIISWICANEDYDIIGDLCMGQGLVAVNAFKAGKRFVGTELNPRRLSAAVRKLAELGCGYEVIDCKQ